jgi:hypothetical protein
MQPIYTLNKGAFGVYKQSVNNNRLTAKEYWIRELSGKDPATRALSNVHFLGNTKEPKTDRMRIKFIAHTRLI